VIFMQSCIRRRLARRELVKLRTEARSANHYKEVSYKLENKVIALTQDLQTQRKANEALK
jgi:myosin-5